MENNIKNTVVPLQKVRISVSPAAAVLCIGLILCGSWMPLCAAALHEFGHLLVMFMTGTRIESIRIALPGADISYSGCRSYGAQFICATAGGIANAVGAAVCLLLWHKYGNAGLLDFAASCMGLAAVNLLPAFPLDGGMALSALLCRFLSCDTAALVMNAISKAVAVCIALTAAYMLFYGIGGAAAVPMCALCVLCWNGENINEK